MNLLQGKHITKRATTQAVNPEMSCCPPDVEGAHFARAWETYAEQTCSFYTVPAKVADSLPGATASCSDEGPSECHVQAPYGTEGGEFLSVRFVEDGSGAWQAKPGSFKLIEGAETKAGTALCDAIRDGTPSRAFLAKSQVEQVLHQIRLRVGAACSDAEQYELVFAQDIGSGLHVGQSDVDSVFIINLALKYTGQEPVMCRIEAMGDSSDDPGALGETFFEDDKEEEELRHVSNVSLAQMPSPRRRSAAAKPAALDSKEAQDFYEDTQRQAEEDFQEHLAEEQETGEKETGAGRGKSAPPDAGVNVVSRYMGTLIYTSMQPSLGCVLGCAGCEEEEEEGTSPLENTNLVEATAANCHRLPGPPRLGSPAASKPPTRRVHPHLLKRGKKSWRPRARAFPSYGDNFHATILTQRTAADHERVWAQSRALIHDAREEGITVPEEYHFFDDGDRAKCFRPAYSQGECGSCWAFASLGALEKQICMRAKGAYSPSLSREMLVRCSEQNGACSGGNADKAYEDLMEIGGVWSTDCLPYQGDGVKHCPAFSYSWFGQGSTGKTGKMARIDQEIMESCHDLTRYTNRPPVGPEWDMPFRMLYESRLNMTPNTSDPFVQRFRRGFAKSRSRDHVPSWWLYGEEAMKTAIVKYGSIYASYIAMDDFKKRACDTGCWPPGTVWGEEAEFHPSSCGCPNNGHAVHIIGYGEEIRETGPRIPYWLIENSWGADIHGDMSGEDKLGVKHFSSPDPFSTLHPMGAEDKCILAGWYSSSLPRTGGCGGNDNVEIRPDIPVLNGPPDGFHLGVEVNGTIAFEREIAAGSKGMFMTELALPPGSTNVSFLVYAKNHPSQQGMFLEKYSLEATSLRCRGKGFGYSFTKNDTRASLSWGRATRRELRQQADNLLIANGIDINQKFDQCDADCRTGSYSEVEPCLGMLLNWGSCYTYDWIFEHAYYLQRMKADCRNCTEVALAQREQALATQSLPNETFIEWHHIVQQAFTAPDEPGFFRQFTGGCRAESRGHNHNTQMTIAYSFDVPDGADGAGGCDERHSAPFAQGKFVNAPGPMPHEGLATQRCPMPLQGEVELSCKSGVLRAESHNCTRRAAHTEFADDVNDAQAACLGLGEANCTESEACQWDSLFGCDVMRMGYFKMLRGYDYHGIETSAAFAIAEMGRFQTLCPTSGWTKWSTCSAAAPCQSGVQHRTREPVNGFARESPGCAELLFNETRPCVGPGFCPQVLTRFLSDGGADVTSALAKYKKESTTLPFGTAGAHILDSAEPNCSSAAYWCQLVTGSSPCDMIFSGHFEVKERGEYLLRYEMSEGGGELEFNTLGDGHEGKPGYKVVGGATSQAYVWRDVGFHHRRRRTEAKPWVPISSIHLERGSHFAQMTRSGWMSCPTYSLVLERSSSVYAPPLLIGVAGYSNATQDELGVGQQRRVWSNKWGAVPEHYLDHRGQYNSYAPAEEEGPTNEVVLRDLGGGTVIARSGINKTNFTADELYDLLGLDKMNPPGARYALHELVLRSTVVLPATGVYKFSYQQDTSEDESNSVWRSNRRRRQQEVVIRVNGSTQNSFTAYQGSTTLELSHAMSEPGEVTFEASVNLDSDGIDTKVALPNSMLVQVKREDTLHMGATGSLEFGSYVAHMSELDDIRGGSDVRVDWPDRDDPFSSELRTSSFKEVMHNEVLIGRAGLRGFMADVEGRIDAGACLALEAHASPKPAEGDNESFAGLAVELCDIDGATQYLELALLSGVNSTRTQLAVVHIGFKEPTHIRLRRDPDDPTQFDVSYRPDNRVQYFSPFGDITYGDSSLLMDVGVSMMTPESYRYAEFYNVSVEDCPDSCDAGGLQVLCGEVHTACGTSFNCTTECPNSGVCHFNECMQCPDVAPPANLSNANCGSYPQVCTDLQNRSIQLHRQIVGEPRPSPVHHCVDGHWHCEGKTKWAYLAEGKQCGEVTNDCGEHKLLFPCPNVRDVCEDHRCECDPMDFSDHDYNCGWAADGCGRNITFGSLGGVCPSAGDLCHERVCCTPKTAADFPNLECGEAPDGCGGVVTLMKSGTIPAPFFESPPTRMTGKNHRGEVGIEFEAATSFAIASLGRGVKSGEPALKENTTLTLWSSSDRSELAHVQVGPSSPVNNSYAMEMLPAYVHLVGGSKYRLSMTTLRNTQDPYPNSYIYNGQQNPAAVWKGKVYSYNRRRNQVRRDYPNYGPSSRRMYGAVNFGLVENEGCGSGATCGDDNMCHTGDGS